MAQLPDLAAGRFLARRRLHLERHHLGRARARRRLDRRRPRGPDHLRRDLRRLRPAARLGTSSMSPPSAGRRCWAARAAHGMLVLSPRAVERLESYAPPWPLPKIFRLTKGGKLIEGIFKGETINTPSMLAVEDWIVALEWAQRHRRADGADRPRRRQCRARSTTGSSARAGSSISPPIPRRARTPASASDRRCGDPARRRRAARQDDRQLLEAEGAAYDIAGYRDAPPGLRIWCGATVEPPTSRRSGPGSTGPSHEGASREAEDRTPT